MRKNIAIFFLIAAGMLCTHEKSFGTPETVKAKEKYGQRTDTLHKKKWKLVWSDEFNYTGLPDSSKWAYEEGLVRNHEKEYYTKERKENVFVKDGFLHVTGIKEHYHNAAYKPGSD